jgi:hypothetical protein
MKDAVTLSMPRRKRMLQPELSISVSVFRFLFLSLNFEGKVTFRPHRKTDFFTNPSLVSVNEYSYLVEGAYEICSYQNSSTILPCILFFHTVYYLPLLQRLRLGLLILHCNMSLNYSN